MRREALRFFRLAGSRLPRSLRAEIVRAIHVGPKTKPPKDFPNYDEFIRHEKSLRLHKLTVSGARLDKKSRALAQEVAPDAETALEERDEFLSWHGEARRIGDEEFAPRDLVDGSVESVVAALDSGEIREDELRDWSLRSRQKLLAPFAGLAKQGRWPAEYWQGLLWFVTEPRERPGPHTRLQEYVARVVLTAPQELVNAIDSAVAGFVKRLAEEYGTGRETELRELWNMAWTGKGDPRPQGLGIDDSLTQALNHPAGKLADAALVRLWKYKLQAGAGLPSAVRPYFVAIGSDPDGHLGRVMLTTRLNHLFAIDPEWTEEHLIGRLRPAQSDEAAELWAAYGWSPMIGPDLLKAFKHPFLEFLQERREHNHRLNNLRGLFMTVCLEAPNELTAEEIRGVVGRMSEEDLKTVLRSLKRRLSGEPAERATTWGDKVIRGSTTIGRERRIAIRPQLLKRCWTCLLSVAKRFRMLLIGHWSTCALWKGMGSIGLRNTDMANSIRIVCFECLTEWWTRKFYRSTNGPPLLKFLIRSEPRMPASLATAAFRGCTRSQRNDRWLTYTS